MDNNGWISVEEQPYPKEGYCIIQTERGCVMPVSNNLIFNDGCLEHRYGDKIIYWQPFPPPIQETNAK